MKSAETQTHNANEYPHQRDRKALRKQLRSARKSLTDKEQQEAAQSLVQMALASEVLKDKKSCAAYISNDGELDPSQLIKHCWQNQIKVTLPVLHPFTAGNLLFLDYRADSVMHDNKYGIPEPLCAAPNVVPLSNIEVLFVPLVGFDNQGNRLGMGGGYYDRTLYSIRGQSLHQNRDAKIIGLAHDCQEVPQLPVQSWDVPLNAIITPTRMINCL